MKIKALAAAVTLAVLGTAQAGGLTPAQVKLVRTPYDGITGMDCGNFNQGGSIKWKNKGGDWYGVGDVLQGGSPYTTFAVPVNASPATISIPVNPALLSQPIWWLRLQSGYEGVKFHSREGAVPPKLVVTLSNGTTQTLLPVADQVVAHPVNGVCVTGNTPILSNVIGLSGHDNMIAWPDIPAGAVSAVFQLTTNKAIHTVGNVGIYVAKYPVSNTPRTSGFASSLADFRDVRNDPRVLYFEDWNQAGLADWWTRTGGRYTQHSPYSWYCGKDDLIPCTSNAQKIIHPDHMAFPGQVSTHMGYPKLGGIDGASDPYWHNQFYPNIYSGNAVPDVSLQSLNGGVEPTELYLSYLVKFSADFCNGDPRTTGGKLPGFTGSTVFGGNGGNPGHGQGWSARMEFNMVHDAQNILRAAGVCKTVYVYPYHADTVEYGDYLAGGEESYIADDKWHCVEQRVKVNSVSTSGGVKVANYDGEVEYWVDGVQGVRKNNYKFRGPGPYNYNTSNDPGKSLAIERLHGALFYGGKYPFGPAAANGTVHVGVDNVTIATQRIGCDKRVIDAVIAAEGSGGASNAAPVVVSAIPDQNVTVGAYNYQVPSSAFRDPNGDALTYSVSGMPAWMSFNAITRTFSGTAVLGTSSITVTATDPSGASASDSFVVTVASSTHITATPSSQEKGKVVDVSWGNIPNASGSNWMGLYANSTDPASAHGGRWFYVSCAQAIGGTRESGNCPYTIPATLAAGTYQWRLYNSSQALLATGTQVVTVPVNAAPTVANPIADQAATEDTAFSFTLPSNTFSDAVGDTISLAASGMPEWMGFNASTRVFSGTPLNGHAGSSTVTVVASDQAGLSVADEFVVTVSAVNDAPVVAQAIADQAATTGVPFSMAIPSATFSDVDDTSLTITVSGVPAWATYSNGTLSGTPTAVANHTVTVRATDAAGAFVEDSFTIAVAAPPVVTTITSTPSTVVQGEQLVAAWENIASPSASNFMGLYAPGAGSSSHGGRWFYVSCSQTAVATRPSGSCIYTVPASLAPGSYELRLYTPSHVLLATAAVTVAQANQAPVVAAAVADASVAEDAALSLSMAGVFSDPEGAALSLSFTGVPAWMSFDGTSLVGTPGNADVGQATVTVRGTDQGGLYAEDSFVVTVSNTNDAPEAVGVANQSATEDGAFSFAIPAGAFTDQDAGDSLTLSAISMPAWMSFDGATFSGTPSNADVGLASVTVRATDAGGLYAETSFDVVTSNANDAPVVDAVLSNQVANEAQLFYMSLANAFADVDVGDSLTYSVSGMPSWMSFDSQGLSISGTPAFADAGSVNLTVRATDAAGAYAEQSFTVQVPRCKAYPVSTPELPSITSMEIKACTN